MPIIKDKTFKDGDPALFVDGESDILITECDFSGTPRNAKGDALEAWVMAMNYANLKIVGCKFFGIIGGAIALRSTMPSWMTSIEYNLIEDVSGNGIIVKPDNFDVSISHNELYNVGQDEKGKKHPIYALGHAHIADNIIRQTLGDGITIRSSGVITRNHIVDVAKSCIRYFSDGVPGASDVLSITDNYCRLPGRGYAAISLLYATDGQMVTRYSISGNKIVGAVMPFLASSEFAGRVEYVPFEGRTG